MIVFEDVFFGMAPASIWKGYTGAGSGSVVQALTGLYTYNINGDPSTRFNCVTASMLTDSIGVCAGLAGNLSGEYLDTLKLAVFSVSGGVITMGTPISVSGSFWFVNGYCGAMCAIDSTRILLVSATTGISGQARVLTVNGGSLTLSVGAASMSVGGAPYTLIKLADGRFIGSTRNPVIWDVSGTAATGSFLFSADPWYPYGIVNDFNCAGRIDDSHFWVNNTTANNTWSVDVISVSGTTGTVASRMTGGGNAVAYGLDSTTLIYSNWNGSAYDIQPLTINTSNYSMTLGSIYSNHPSSSGLNITPDNKAHLSAGGTSTTATIAPVTYDTGTIVFGSPITTYTWDAQANRCNNGYARFPTDTTRMLQYIGHGSDARLRVLRAA